MPVSDRDFKENDVAFFKGNFDHALLWTWDPLDLDLEYAYRSDGIPLVTQWDRNIGISGWKISNTWLQNM